MLKSLPAADPEVLKAALNCLPDPVLVVGGSLHILFANEAAAAHCGIDLEGQLVVAALRHPNAIDCLNRVAESRVPSATRVTMTDNGIEVPFKMSAASISLSGQGEDALVVTLRDDGDSDGAEQMRRSFVANVSHELRSPLSALTACVETLKHAPPEEREAQIAFLDLMDQETRRMNRLISDLLSLSKVESNERVRPTTPIRINDVLQPVIRSLQPSADEHRSELRLTGAADDLRVIGDADQLSQVFRNLVENALKYGRAGGRVDVSCRREESCPEDPGRTVAVAVSDEGAGIEAAHIPRLTERFYRIDDHRSRSVGGTGLGLAIVKHIVQRHRGHLSITSEPGKGSVFRVSLPAAAP